jgi:uncharacterized protein YutE (UPF0331/DUF86 family)
VVDATVRAVKTAAILEAVRWIRENLPDTVEQFHEDRLVRDSVIFNLFVAIQEAIDLATHWVADEGWAVPDTYGAVFRVLAEHSIVEWDLARRLVKAAGLRNLIAHQYGTIDFDRIYASASADLDDLIAFCHALAG